MGNGLKIKIDFNKLVENNELNKVQIERFKTDENLNIINISLFLYNLKPQKKYKLIYKISDLSGKVIAKSGPDEYFISDLVVDQVNGQSRIHKIIEKKLSRPLTSEKIRTVWRIIELEENKAVGEKIIDFDIIVM